MTFDFSKLTLTGLKVEDLELTGVPEAPTPTSTDNSDRIATTKFVRQLILDSPSGPSLDSIYITGGGTTSNRNDNSLFQEKGQEAIENNRKLVIVPDKDKSFRLTQTWDLQPPSGKNEFYLDIEAHGVPRGQLQYDGPEGTACISAIGHRFGIWSGIKIALANTPGLIAFDLDTKSAENGQPAMDSTTHNTYLNCHVALGSLLDQNQKGWRIGYESGGGGDISDLTFINTSVFGRFGAPNANDYGWQIYGGNVLQNTWTNPFTAFCGKGYSNVSDVQGKTGNGASYFYGAGSSQNLLDFEIGNSQSYLIAGGRGESGKQILHVTQGNISPAISFQGCQWDDYQGVSNFGGGSDNLFFLDMPASLSIDNCNIKSGRWGSYSSNMIKAYGPGGQGLFGTIMVRGGGIQSAGSSFINTGSDPTWVKRIDTVKRLDSQGRTIAMFDNI